MSPAFIMAKITINPVLHANLVFDDVEVLPPRSPKNSGDSTRFQLAFIPAESLCNGVVMSPDQVRPLGIKLNTKVDQAFYDSVKSTLKAGSRYVAQLSPDSYSINNSSGVWYKLHKLSPANG